MHSSIAQAAWLALALFSADAPAVSPQQLKPLATINAHAGPVSALAATPDGQWLISGGFDEHVLVWKPQEERPRQKFHAHRSFVLSANFSADGKRAVTGGIDETARLFFMPGAQPDAREQLTPEGPYIMALDSSGDTLAAASGERIIVRPLAAESPSLELSAPTQVTALAWEAQGKYLLAGNTTGSLDLWNRDGRWRATIAPAQGTVSAVALLDHSPGEPQIVSAAGNGIISVWNRLEHVDSLTPGSGPMLLSSDGKRLVTGSGKELAIWQVKLGGPFTRLKDVELPATVWTFAWQDDSSCAIVAALGDKSFHRVDASTGSCAPIKLPPATSRPQAAAAHPSQGSPKAAPSGKENPEGKGPKEEAPQDASKAAPAPPTPSSPRNPVAVTAVALSRDGTRLAAAYDDQSLRVFDLTGAQPSTIHVPSKKTIRRLSFVSPVPNLLMALADDDTAALWNIQGGPEVGETFAGATQYAISPDGSLLVIGEKRGRVTIYRVQAPAPSAAPAPAAGAPASSAAAGTSKSGGTPSAAAAARQTPLATRLASLCGREASPIRTLFLAAMPKDEIVVAAGAESSSVSLWHLSVGGSAVSERFKAQFAGENEAAIRCVGLVPTSTSPATLFWLRSSPSDADAEPAASTAICSAWSSKPTEITGGESARFKVIALLFDRIGNRIVAVRPSKVEVIDARSGQVLLTRCDLSAAGHGAVSISAAALSTDSTQIDSTQIIVATNDPNGHQQTLQIFDSYTGDSKASLSFDSPITSLATGRVTKAAPTLESADVPKRMELLLAVGLADGTVQTIDLRDPSAGAQQSVPCGFASPITLLALAHDGPMLVAGSSQGLLHRWSLGLPDSFLGTLYSVGYLPAREDKPALLSLAGAGEAPYQTGHSPAASSWQIWSMPKSDGSHSHTPIAIHPAGMPIVYATASFAEDAGGAPVAHLFAAGSSRNIARWKLTGDAAVTEETQLSPPGAIQGPFLSLAVAPTAKRLAAGSAKDGVVVWNLAGEPVAHPLHHAGAAYAMAFNSKGSRLATIARQGMLRVWQIAPAVAAMPLSEQQVGAPSESYCVTWVDDHRLAVGSADGQIWYFEAPAESP